MREARLGRIGVALLLLAAPTAGQSPLDPERLGWTELELRARKLGFGMRVSVSLAVTDGKSVVDEMTRPDGFAGLDPSGHRVVRLVMDRRGVGGPAESTLWIDAGDAGAYQYRELQAGKRQRYRLRRYAESAIWSQRRAPVPGEEALQAERWSDVAEEVLELDGGARGDLALTEPLGLFYVVAAAGLDQAGDALRFPAFSRGRRIEVEARVLGRVVEEVGYERGDGGGRVKGARELIRIVIRALDTDGDAEGRLRFLGLRGDIELLLDPETRAPLQISGRVPRAGAVKVRVREMR
ncbi:MAG: hypothetical protein R3190_01285 [Thermoanaerobaculia bacterium]|nr:hypothetical protein [Thermoanaerobaculia bacterium]